MELELLKEWTAEERREAAEIFQQEDEALLRISCFIQAFSVV